MKKERESGFICDGLMARTTTNFIMIICLHVYADTRRCIYGQVRRRWMYAVND